MLEKKIDSLIFGHNYYSLLLGIKQSQEGESVLLIDDARTTFSPFFMQQTGELDRQILVELGQSLKIESLVQVDQYLTMTPCFYQLGLFRIRLGDLPFRNFSELCRRFHFAFAHVGESFEDWCKRNDVTAASFNRDYSAFIRNFVIDLLQSKVNGSFDLPYFRRCAPAFLQDIFNSFINWEKQRERADQDSCNLRCLLAVLRSQFQQNLSPHSNSSELFFLLMMMLSPNYRMNNHQLNEALEQKFKLLNGKIRQVEMGEWLFENGKPWAVKLSSFEGVVMPERQAIVGNLSSTFPLEVDHQHKFYTSLVFKWELSAIADHFIPNQPFCFANPDRLGTDFPFFFMEKNDEGLFELRIFYFNAEASKKEFLQDDLRDELLNQLAIAFHFNRSWILSEKIIDGHDITLSYNIDRDRLPLTSHASPRLFDTSIINHKEVVRQVAYYGVFRCFAMGKISLLKDLCPNVGVISAL